jgi:hypothetical protein
VPRSGKPRKAYRPRAVAVDALDHAIALAAVPPKSSQAALIAPMRVALDQLRRGAGDAQAWDCLADAHNVALALADLRIANDHRSTLTAGCQALAALSERVNAGGSWTLRGVELAALQASVEIHEIQLGLASQREIRDAIAAVQRTVRGVLSGSPPQRARIAVIGALGVPSKPQESTTP